MSPFNLALGPIFPSEIILMIGIILKTTHQKATLSSLSQCSHNTYEILTPLLYQSVIVPQRNSLAGIMYNFGHLIPDYSMFNIWVQPTNQDFVGPQRGFRLLNMIQDLTLESIPKVTKIIQGPATSYWHELKILTNHHQVLQAHKRLKRFTFTGQAIQQLQSPEGVHDVRFDPISNERIETGQVIMPSDGLPPPPDDDEFSFFPQSGLPLDTLIAYYQPLHLIIQYPLTWYQAPFPPTPRRGPLPLNITRPHEFVLRDALEGLDGKGTSVCVHGIHDQCPPITHLGARIHASFIAFPSVPVRWQPNLYILPYVNIQHRLTQIMEVIKRSNPQIPNPTTVINAHRPLTLDRWETSKETHWTFYRVGAMITDITPKDEWVHGAAVEDRVRQWLDVEFAESKGHPEGFAEDINARLEFVHGGPDEDPDDLICEGCGHVCRVPSE